MKLETSAKNLKSGNSKYRKKPNIYDIQINILNAGKAAVVIVYHWSSIKPRCRCLYIIFIIIYRNFILSSVYTAYKTNAC